MEKYMGFLIPVISLAVSVITAFAITKHKTDQHGEVLKQHTEKLSDHHDEITVLKTEAKHTKAELDELKKDIKKILDGVNEIKINLAKLPCDRKGGASC